jgi:type IV secretion system protein VirB8
VSAEGVLDAYFGEAASWDADRANEARTSAKRAWIVAGAGWLCAVASAAAMILLTPLKSVEPFVIRVDNSTGIVDVVPVYAGKAEMSQTVTRYLLAHYITVCQRFAFATAESDYEECGALQGASRNQEWSRQWATANPASPLNLYKDGTTVVARVTSVSFFERANRVGDLAQVRYVEAKRLGSGAHESLTHWIATIQYAYTDPSMDPKIRQWNPLGFRVLDFRPEPETGTETSSVSPPDAPPTSSPGASR